MSTPAEEVQPERQPSVQIREACRSCGRKVSKHSRQGLYWKCPNCGTYNIGPKLREEMTKQPDPGARRRTTRRARAAEQRAERAVSAEPAPAPARVTRAAKPATAAPNPAPKPAAPRAAEAPKPKGGIMSALERLTWGGED